MLKRTLSFVLAISIFTASGAIVFRFTQGDRLLSVQSASMEPQFSRGDAVVTKEVRLASLRVGDVISYRSPADSRVIVSHRLVAVDYVTGKLITKGDAVAVQDIAFPVSKVVGKVNRVLPGMGAPLDWLHTTTGLVVAVYAPAAAVLIYEAKRLSKRYTRPYYTLYGYR